MNDLQKLDCQVIKLNIELINKGMSTGSVYRTNLRQADQLLFNVMYRNYSDKDKRIMIDRAVRLYDSVKMGLGL